MTQSLSERERELLINLQERHTDPAIMRRAQIVLLAESDLSTADIADAVSLSAGQVRYWRREWEKRGMAIFPKDAPQGVEGDGERSRTGDETVVDEPPDEEPRLPLTLRDSIGIEPTDPMAEAGRKALLFHFERMLLHEPGSRLGEDIEAVHDMRVATRRMRSAFRLFAPYYKHDKVEAFQRNLKHTGRALGAVRDLDVFMEKAQRFIDAHPEADLSPLVEAWQARLDEARPRLIKHLDSPRFDHFVHEFYAFLTTPGAGAKKAGDRVPTEARHVLPQLIYGLYEQVRVYDDVADTRDISTLHALRIELKRLRYALEFFVEILGPEARAVIRDVKAMQDHLGDLNDAEVAEGILSEFVAQHDHANSGTPRFLREPDISGVVQYLAATRAEKDRLLATFPEAWADFRREDVRRNLALAVAAL